MAPVRFSYVLKPVLIWLCILGGALPPLLLLLDRFDPPPYSDKLDTLAGQLVLSVWYLLCLGGVLLVEFGYPTIQVSDQGISSRCFGWQRRLIRWREVREIAKRIDRIEDSAREEIYVVHGADASIHFTASIKRVAALLDILRQQARAYRFPMQEVTPDAKSPLVADTASIAPAPWEPGTVRRYTFPGRERAGGVVMLVFGVVILGAVLMPSSSGGVFVYGLLIGLGALSLAMGTLLFWFSRRVQLSEHGICVGMLLRTTIAWRELRHVHLRWRADRWELVLTGRGRRKIRVFDSLIGFQVLVERVVGVAKAGNIAIVLDGPV